MSEPDLVIVGGGIAGSALATVMARAGASVIVLERQREYRDQVRGEILWPWGVRAARFLGIESVLLEAGALVVGWLDTYDEGADGPTGLDVGAVIDGVNGSVNLTHPTACTALAETAAAAGPRRPRVELRDRFDTLPQDLTHTELAARLHGRR